MPDINPIHWLLIVLAALLAVLWGAYSFQGHQFELEKARHSAFVAETKAVGLVQERQGKEQHAADEQRKKGADSEIDIARKHIYYYADELRKSAKNTRGSLLPTAPSSAGSTEGICFDSTQLTAAMGRYSEEMGSIRREATELVIYGAKAVVDLDGAKNWAQDKK